ncbi:MAG: hypothetical protein JO129_03685 [Candidatus Dependentiae bacterium]|nr:hypothetical protein [Candidatus Dependentiae bacterium]
MKRLSFGIIFIIFMGFELQIVMAMDPETRKQQIVIAKLRKEEIEADLAKYKDTNESITPAGEEFIRIKEHEIDLLERTVEALSHDDIDDLGEIAHEDIRTVRELISWRTQSNSWRIQSKDKK